MTEFSYDMGDSDERQRLALFLVELGNRMLDGEVSGVTVRTSLTSPDSLSVWFSGLSDVAVLVPGARITASKLSADVIVSNTIRADKVSSRLIRGW